MTRILKRLVPLGYRLAFQQNDALGKKHRYRTSPCAGSGPINYFDTKEQLERWIAQVEQVREWQAV